MKQISQEIVTAFHLAIDGYYRNGEWIQDYPGQIADALQVLVDKVAPSDSVEPRNSLPMAIECQRIRKEILDIINDLKSNSKNYL